MEGRPPSCRKGGTTVCPCDAPPNFLSILRTFLRWYRYINSKNMLVRSRPGRCPVLGVNKHLCIHTGSNIKWWLLNMIVFQLLGRHSFGHNSIVLVQLKGALVLIPRRYVFMHPQANDGCKLLSSFRSLAGRHEGQSFLARLNLLLGHPEGPRKHTVSGTGCLDRERFAGVEGVEAVSRGSQRGSYPSYLSSSLAYQGLILFISSSSAYQVSPSLERKHIYR